MRILHVCADPGIPPDGSKGASVHLRCIAAALKDVGNDITTLVRRAPEAQAGFPVPLELLDESGSVLVRSGRPDLVFERYSLGHVRGLEAARAWDVPFVLEVNAPLVAETRRFRPERLEADAELAEAALLRGADLVVTVSEPLRRWAIRLRGSEAGTLVVPNGFDPELYGTSASTTEAGAVVLVFLGHPKPWHGAERLPDLVAALAERGHDACGLVIGGGPGAEAVRARAERAGVAERIEITGPVSQGNAARHLRRGTIMVAPYPQQDDFYFCPLKVIEGMAAGLPVVASALGDVPDLVGDAGVVLPASDTAAWVDALDQLLRDGTRRRELGRRARDRAFLKYRWRDHAEVLTEHMRALVQEHAQ